MITTIRVTLKIIEYVTIAITVVSLVNKARRAIEFRKAMQR